MKFNNNLALFRSTVLVLVLTAGFANCADDSQETKPQPPVVEEEQPKADPEDTAPISDVAPVVCDFAIVEDTLTARGWTKAFEEQFNGDLSQWNIWTGGAFNNEMQHYQASNLTVQDGVLTITVKKETVKGANNPYDNTQKTFDYTSGRIESKSMFSANNTTKKVRIMARIKLPSGYGMWPAFWIYGDPWPTQGEIDIIEARGQEPTKYQTNYFYGTASGTNLVTGAEFVVKANSDLTTCYHIYELIWEQSKLTTILDGTVMERKTSGGYVSNLFGTQQKIVLNQAVGGLFFSGLDPSKIQPGTMQVDWVRVYTK